MSAKSSACSGRRAGTSGSSRGITATSGSSSIRCSCAPAGSRFSWSERSDGGYRIPDGLHEGLGGKAVAIVDDVVNAGSASRATLTELRACGARPVALGALLTLGAAPSDLAQREGLALEALAALPNTLWAPSECPMCAVGEPVEDPGLPANQSG